MIKLLISNKRYRFWITKPESLEYYRRKCKSKDNDLKIVKEVEV